MALTDSSKFPFGKYKGRKMKEVPAEYLDWLHGQPWIEDWGEVLAYIKASRKVIDQELADKRYEKERKNQA